MLLVMSQATCPLLLLQSRLPTLLKVPLSCADFILDFSCPFSVLYANSSVLHNCYAALEPFFNAAATQFVLGQTVPLSLWLSLAPVVLGNFSIKPSVTSLLVKL